MNNRRESKWPKFRRRLFYWEPSMIKKTDTWATVLALDPISFTTVSSSITCAICEKTSLLAGGSKVLPCLNSLLIRKSNRNNKEITFFYFSFKIYVVGSR